jgi:acyl-CoA oxidase
MMNLSTVIAEPDSTDRILGRALRGRKLSPFECRLIEVLHEDIFRRTDDMRTSEQCALSYQRLRYLNDRLSLRIDDLVNDIDRLTALHEWVTLVDGTLTTLITVHFNLCIGSILRHHADRRHVSPYLDELERMDSIGVFLATELAYGNNVQSLETEAVYDLESSEFILHTPSTNAQKFMPNTGAEGVAKLAVVLARLKVGGRNCGVFPFVVRIRTEHALCPGVRVTPLGDKPDYPLDNAITAFDHVRIPKRNWLSGEESRIDDQGSFSSAIASRGHRFLRAMDRVQTGKLCLSVAALSSAYGALQLTLQYAQQRKTFALGRSDVPILHYRTYQRAVFEAVATAYACAFLIQHVTSHYRQRMDGDGVEASRLLALGKVFTSSRATRIMSVCRERVGAQGMFSANRIITYWIYANGIVTAEGDNEVILSRFARELLLRSDYEPPEQIPANRWPPLLESADFLISLVSERERRLHGRLVAALGVRQGTVFDTWNAHLGEALELASVHSVRLSLECFNRALDPIEDPAARAVLDRLLRLFALQEIAEFSTELIADGTLGLDLGSQIGPERSRLAGELYGDASLLRDAFGIPNSLLEAPIGGDYIAAYDPVHSLLKVRGSYIRATQDVSEVPQDAAQKRGA